MHDCCCPFSAWVFWAGWPGSSIPIGGLPPTSFLSLANIFIVTAVLGVLLELFSAKLLIERVSEDLAQRVIGRGLPAELQASIRDIVATDLARDHYVKSYAFSTPEDGLVNVDIEVRYELRNYSEAVRGYAPEIAAEIFSQPEFRFLEYGIAGRKIHTFSDENLSNKVETVDELNVRRVPRSALPPVSLKPVRTGEKSACQVTWRYHVTVPEQYCDVIDFGEATLGATLHVQNIPEELEFVSAAMRPCTMRSAASPGISINRSSPANICAPGGSASPLCDRRVTLQVSRRADGPASLCTSMPIYLMSRLIQLPPWGEMIRINGVFPSRYGSPEVRCGHPEED